MIIGFQPVRRFSADRLFRVVERTRSEILGATDPSFIHHDDYAAKLPKVNVGGAVYKELRSVGQGKARRWEAVFSTGSARRAGVAYEQRVVLADLEPMLRDRKSKMTFLDRVRQAANGGDLKVSCSCPAHLYWGYKWIDTNLGVAAPGMKEFRPPDIRNPQRRGSVCKHLDLVLNVLPANAPDITRDLKLALGAETAKRRPYESYGMARLSSVLY